MLKGDMVRQQIAYNCTGHSQQRGARQAGQDGAAGGEDAGRGTRVSIDR